MVCWCRLDRGKKGLEGGGIEKGGGSDGVLRGCVIIRFIGKGLVIPARPYFPPNTLVIKRSRMPLQMPINHLEKTNSTATVESLMFFNDRSQMSLYSNSSISTLAKLSNKSASSIVNGRVSLTNCSKAEINLCSKDNKTWFIR